MRVKKWTLLAITLLLVAVIAGTALPAAEAAPLRQADAETRTITVTGIGTAYGAPDIVMVGLGVEAINENIQVAMDDTTARMNAVMQALMENGVAREDIRTDRFSIYQEYSGQMSPDGQQPQAYRVSNGVTIIVRQVDQVSTILAAAVNAGANMVNYIQFDIEDRTPMQDTARANAVENAQARAEHLAGLMGLAVGEPLEIVENNDVYSPVGMGGGGGAGYAANAVPISEGQLSVNMAVTVTYALVPAN